MKNHSTFHPHQHRGKSANHSPDPASVIVNITANHAVIYQATPIQSFRLPISIYESSALFMELMPGWWQSELHAEEVRQVVFTLANKEREGGLYFIQPLPADLAKRFQREAGRYILRVNDLEERRAAR